MVSAQSYGRQVREIEAERERKDKGDHVVLLIAAKWFYFRQGRRGNRLPQRKAQDFCSRHGATSVDVTIHQVETD